MVMRNVRAAQDRTGPRDAAAGGGSLVITANDIRKRAIARKVAAAFAGSRDCAANASVGKTVVRC
jgi:hypothetical protein